MRLWAVVLFLFLSPCAFGQSGVCAGYLPFPCLPQTPTTNAPIWAEFPVPAKFIYPNMTVGQMFVLPTSGERAMWITGPTNPCGSGSNNQSWVTMSISNLMNITNDDTYFVIFSPNVSPGVPCIVKLARDGNNTITGVSSTLSLTGILPFGSFGRASSSSHTFYTVDVTNHFQLKSTDVATDINSGIAYTNIADLSSSSVCPNMPGGLATTNQGEVSVSANERYIGYWFDGSQNNADMMAVYDTGGGGCMWWKLATGDVNAASGWGMNTTTCTACIPSQYRTNGANFGLHRATLATTNDPVTGCPYLVVENQNFTASNLIFTVPCKGGAWPGTLVNTCTIGTSSYCGNHNAFGYNGLLVSGQGNTGDGAGQAIANRVRLASSADTVATITSPLSALNGYADVRTSFTVGVVCAQTASHLSWAAADVTLVTPFLTGAYQGGPCAGPTNFPWQQELDLVSPNPNNQIVYRAAVHHMRSQFGSMTQNSGVSGNGATTSVTTVGPHSFTATQTGIKIYNCIPSTVSINNTTFTVATAPTSTTFTFSNAFNGTADCMFSNPAANAQEFWATTLVQEGHTYILTPDNAERTYPAETGTAACNGGNCPQKHILWIEIR